MKLLTTVDLGQDNFKEIEKLGYEINYIRERELKNRDDIYDADVLLTFTGFKNMDMDKFDRLRYIMLPSTGFNQVPKDFIESRGIILSNNPRGYAKPMAEFVALYILEFYKKARKFFKQQEECLWKMDLDLLEMEGKRVGILGTGHIAQVTASRLKAFEMEVWGVNTNGRMVEGFDRCFAIDDADEVYRECDVVIGILPATDATTNLINDSKLGLMKKGAILINVGRGNLINLGDLEKHLDKFMGVALDVTDVEPLDKESYLWNAENVIITPHNSGEGDNNMKRMFDQIYMNLKAYADTGMPKEYIRDLRRGY